MLYRSRFIFVALVVSFLTGCSLIPDPFPAMTMDTSVPSATPVPADETLTIAEQRLELTQWWLPSTATDVAVAQVDDTTFPGILNIFIITFHADREDVMAMVPKGYGHPFYMDGNKLGIERQRMLSVVGAPDSFRFAASNSTTYPFDINVLILPDEGDTPQITILSYYQAR